MIDLLNQYSPDARAIRGLDTLGGIRVRSWIGHFFAMLASLIAIAAIVLRAPMSAHVPPVIILLQASLLSLIQRIPGVTHSTGDLTIRFIPGIHEAAITLPRALGIWGGIFLFSLGCYGLMKVLNAYARSHRFRDLANIERGVESLLPQFMVQEVFVRAKRGDLVGAFFASDNGFMASLRAGVSADSLSEFMKSRMRPVDYRERDGIRTIRTFADLAVFIARDPAVSQFLQTAGVKPDDWRRAAEWVSRERHELDVRLRYWGRTALSKSSPMFDELAYGFGVTLKKFARELEVPAPRLHVTYGSAEVSRMEDLLIKNVGANVLLVAPSVELALDVVKDFARDIVYHFPHPALRNKKCMVLDTQAFAQSCSSREDFENLLMTLAVDAHESGNVILVIDDVSALYIRADQLGADLDALMRKLLVSPLPIIFLADEAMHSRVVRQHPGTLDHMHEVKVKEASDDALISLLEDEASRAEREHGILFTTPAIARIAQDATRTRVQGLLSVRAKEILHAIPSWASRDGINVILPSHVDTFVSMESGIQVGRAGSEERDLLLSIEEKMRERVIGQTRAIELVATAMRRARGGMRDENKPMASFLFLGPTGVGKTEVAKTLAATYFGNETAMVRFDMSEYSGQDALDRLIGTSSAPGLLAISAREHPYGVLLLDEFEKAAKPVHDLMLQVLDEGVFHDGQGNIVNCRNLIVIATSNAGSREIRLALSQNAELDASSEKGIIDAIIAAGIYRPELLNRFDGTVLFSPLSMDDYRKIARLMLEKLAKRTQQEHGAILVVDDTLVESILANGIDADFGARPLARLIQEKVADPLAEKVLRGEVTPGQEIRL